MREERVPSGIDGLDIVIKGGFPSGSLILVAGNPGTGKTVFSAKFLYTGAVSHDENGVYVSFVENRRTFYWNMKSFGFDFEKLEEKGKFKFLDMVTVREAAVSSVLERVMDEVHKINAKRLVIDSFSAMAQAFEKPIDARIVVHTILSRIIRQLNCTTLMIVETPIGEERIGLGIEEFVADGAILLRRGMFDDILLREMEIQKLRGTRIVYPKFAFTLEGGFHVFPPLTVRGIKQPTGRYEVIPHGKDHFSTGIRDLDRILKGMFRRGGYNLLEIEKDVAFPLERLTRPTVCNFLNQGHGVLIVPPQGVSAETIINSLTPYVDSQLLKRNLKVANYQVEAGGQPAEPYILSLKGESVREDLKAFWDAVTELREKTGKPIFSIVGYDTVEYTYGEREALKTLGEDVARTRNLGDLRLNIIRPTVYIADQLRALAHIYLKVNQINGALFIHGVKPKTPLLNVNLTTKKGISKVKLTPIV
jgi:circadian clock protein KaiC